MTGDCAPFRHKSVMGQTRWRRKPIATTSSGTLLKLAKPKMSPKELLRETRKLHPEASKKDIVRAAFASIIAVADEDGETALALHDFAIKERGADDLG